MVNTAASENYGIFRETWGEWFANAKPAATLLCGSFVRYPFPQMTSTLLKPNSAIRCSADEANSGIRSIEVTCRASLAKTHAACCDTRPTRSRH